MKTREKSARDLEEERRALRQTREELEESIDLMRSAGESLGAEVVKLRELVRKAAIIIRPVAREGQLSLDVHTPPRQEMTAMVHKFTRGDVERAIEWARLAPPPTKKRSK